MFLSREIFSKSVFSLALLFNSSIGIANTCNDLIDQDINDFVSLCSGSIECVGQHPSGHFVPTGQFVGRTPSANIASGKLELKCQLQGECAPGTYGFSGVPDRSFDLCNANLSYLSLETKTSSTLHANNIKYCGSVVGLDDQTLGESIPITGAKFSLNYFSHFNAGRGNYSIIIPLSGAVPDGDTSSFNIKISSDDGEYVSEIVTNQANLSYNYIWNGKNKLGQKVGLKKFKIELIQNFLSDPQRITLSESVVLGALMRKNWESVDGCRVYISSIIQKQNNFLVEMEMF